jgi:hypothetical protein
MKTLVLQSYKTSGAAGWLKACHKTVKNWATSAGYEYRFLGNELFEYVPAWFKRKCAGQILPVTDLARLQWMQKFLREGASRVLWVDYDVVILNRRFSVPQDVSLLFTEERYVRRARDGRLVEIDSINNSVMMIARGSPVLEFLIEAILARGRHIGRVVDPGFAGTRLLTDLARVFEPPLLRSVAFITPTILIDLARGSDYSLNMLSGSQRDGWSVAHLNRSAGGKYYYGVYLNDLIYTRALGRLLNAAKGNSGIGVRAARTDHPDSARRL